MTSDKVNWKKLFLKARRMHEDEERRHAFGCGCRDGKAAGSEGLCPGVKERVRFLKDTEKFLTQEGRKA